MLDCCWQRRVHVIPAVGTERRQGLPPWSGRLQVLPAKPQALLGRSPPGQWCLRRSSRVRQSDRSCLLLPAGMRWPGIPLRGVLDSITVRLRSRHPGAALDCLRELVPCAPRRIVDSCIARRVQQRSKWFFLILVGPEWTPKQLFPLSPHKTPDLVRWVV